VTQSQQLPQFVVLERITAVLKGMQHVRAALVRGSFRSGQPDVYSDLDLVVVAEGADDEAMLAIGRAALKTLGRVLWVSTHGTIPPRLRALLPGPMRLDLSLVAPGALPIYDGWRVLFDYGGQLRDRDLAHGQEPLQPEHIVQACDEFWWSMFSSVGHLKRGQLWMALSQLDACRAVLAQMMRWRRDPERPGERFADLERHLTAEDQQALAQTLAGYDLRSIAEALLCAADAFDPAARDVSARLGAVYPAALAHETKTFFIREFWALLAPGPAISA
jgi:predicted nucleotidyltransferase